MHPAICERKVEFDAFALSISHTQSRRSASWTPSTALGNRASSNLVQHFDHALPFYRIFYFNERINAAVNGKLELTLLKGRQRFDTVSTSNLKV